MHPFFTFIALILILCAVMIIAALVLLLCASMVTRAIDGIGYSRLLRRLTKNPACGRSDEGRAFIIEQGRFTLTYTWTTSLKGKNSIEVLSMRKRRWWHERTLSEFKRTVRNFLLYDEWLMLFQPRTFLIGLVILAAVYFMFYEPQEYKSMRWRKVIAGMLHVPLKSVAVAPGGKLTLSAQRETIVDDKIEPISYNVDLFKWFTFLDDGYIAREKSDNYGEANYSVVYHDDRNIIDLKKDDKWIEGNFTLKEVDWKQRQGTGIREGYVLHQKEVYEPDRILIKDTKVTDENGNEVRVPSNR